jgi:hypothetical protein
VNWLAEDHGDEEEPGDEVAQRVALVDADRAGDASA